jgi:hypothetical protein
MANLLQEALRHAQMTKCGRAAIEILLPPKPALFSACRQNFSVVQGTVPKLEIDLNLI